MKMSASWRKERAVRKKKQIMVKTKIRWSLLGLQDPACAKSTPSMQEIRREINLMASQGLERGARSNSDAEEAIPRLDSDANTFTRKRRRGAVR